MMDHSFFLHYSLMDIWVVPTFLFFFKFFYLVVSGLFGAHGILVASRGIFHCGSQALWLWRVGSAALPHGRS